jgi:hypothetical protein
MIWRYLPPNGGGTDDPATVASWLRTLYCAWSRSCVSLKPWPATVTSATGSDDAPDLSTSGGSVPGGRWRRSAIARFESDAAAESTSTLEWKKTLMMLTPGSERDSMCSMPLPSVKKRSKRVVMLRSTSVGGMPG